MKQYFILLTVFTAAIVSASSVVLAKEASLQTDRAQALNDTAFQRAIEVNKPNEMQVLLTNLIGEWDYMVTVWTGANAKPEKSTGTSVNEMILEGRFISTKASGLLNIGGHYVPYAANGLLGYDNVQKVFTSVWVDNLNPGMMVGSGTFDKANNAIKESGNFTSSIKEAAQTYRSEIQFTDAESYKRIIFSTDKSGKEYKVMEFVYRHKK